MTPQIIINKVWEYCNVLRDDGVSYGDYLEQITYLIFLKMADEYSKPPHKKEIGIPDKYNWENLASKKGVDLETHYNNLLKSFATKEGLLGQIFTKSQNKIQEPKNLNFLVQMIDKENWATMEVDVKGQIYEGLLEKNAEDTKSGAGQYFTPRALISTIVECVAPEQKKSIADPACGTGGFFLAAYHFLEKKELNKNEKNFLKKQTFFGNEIVANTRRLCLMNLFLNNIGNINEKSSIDYSDSLIAANSKSYDYVLTNPPFGTKGSMSETDEKGKKKTQKRTYNRKDFWVPTSNKQFNFLQHIWTMLKTTGKAAVVVPDNVLFEGGAGETIRENILERTNLHTILRLPTGIFYKPGVKANVFFFDKRPASPNPQTKEIWYYDYRTNIHHTLKTKPLQKENLQEFIDCYKPKNIHERQETYHPKDNPNGRWKKYSYQEIIEDDKTSLDKFWLKDDKMMDLDNLPEPEILAKEIVKDLNSGLKDFQKITQSL